jgi:hypothetical protein
MILLIKLKIRFIINISFIIIHGDDSIKQIETFYYWYNSSGENKIKCVIGKKIWRINNKL